MAATPKCRPGRGWFVQICQDGKRKSKKCPDEATARAVAAEHNRRMAPKDLTVAGPKLFASVAEAWWNAYSGEWADTTRTTRRTGLARLLERIGSRDMRGLDDKAISAVAVSLCPPHTELAAATVRFVGDQLAAVMKFAVDEGILRARPHKRGIRGVFERVAAAKCAPPNTADAWTHDEARALLAMAQEQGAWLYEPLLFALRTGCRIGELVALEWGDVDLDRGLVTFRQSRSAGLRRPKPTKTNKIRTRDLASDVLELLRGMHARRASGAFPRGRWARTHRADPGDHVFLNSVGEPWLAGSLSSIWGKKRSLCPNVKPLKWHCTRHTFASWALDEGWKPSDCAYYIGDTLEVFLGHYAHMIRGKHLDLDFFTQKPSAGDPPRSPALPGTTERRLVLLPPG
jgi:integrase